MLHYMLTGVSSLHHVTEIFVNVTVFCRQQKRSKKLQSSSDYSGINQVT